MSKTVHIELSENQAAHLWGILVHYNEEAVRVLKSMKIYKGDGTINRNRKNLTPFQAELDDNIHLSKLISDHIESQIDVFGLIEAEDEV